MTGVRLSLMGAAISEGRGHSSQTGNLDKVVFVECILLHSMEITAVHASRGQGVQFECSKMLSGLNHMI